MKTFTRVSTAIIVLIILAGVVAWVVEKVWRTATIAPREADLEAHPGDVVLPYLKPRAAVDANADGALVVRFSDSLYTLFVLDRPRIVRVVTKDDFATLGKTPEQLMNDAGTALMARSRDTRIKNGPVRDSVCIVPTDDFTAARIVIDSVRAELDKAVGGTAVFAIPTRAELCAVNATNVVAMRSLHAWAKGRSTDTYALTDKLIKLEDHTYVEFEPPR